MKTPLLQYKLVHLLHKERLPCKISTLTAKYKGLPALWGFNDFEDFVRQAAHAGWIHFDSKTQELFPADTESLPQLSTALFETSHSLQGSFSSSGAPRPIGTPNSPHYDSSRWELFPIFSDKTDIFRQVAASAPATVLSFSPSRKGDAKSSHDSTPQALLANLNLTSSDPNRFSKLVEYMRQAGEGKLFTMSSIVYLQDYLLTHL